MDGGELAEITGALGEERGKERGRYQTMMEQRMKSFFEWLLARNFENF